MTIRDRLQGVWDRIERAAERAGRDASEIRLVAVSKTFGVPEILEARTEGQHLFGENRAQELAQKIEVIPEKVDWHFVGHLQTNKVKQVVGLVSLIHSVDSRKVAEAIARRATAGGITQNVLLEVNVAGDVKKHGEGPDEIPSLVKEINEMEGIAVKGLMTIPPWPDDPQDSRPHYARLAALAEEIRSDLGGAVELSMGMTRDFEVAIEEGATLVRVGEAIFGRREG